MASKSNFIVNGVQHQNGINVEESPVYKGTTKYKALPETMNILVTGGAGFIASWLVRHLVLTYPNYHITVFDKMDYCASLKNLSSVIHAPNFTFFYGDITSLATVLRCLRAQRINTIFHFAAQSHVDLSFGNSFEFTKNNVEGTHVILEAAVAVGTINRFVHVSTDEVNGGCEFGDLDLLEESILSPTNPYAASKAAAEMYVNAYSKSFKLPAIIVRSNNVYGPHQYPESKSR